MNSDKVIHRNPSSYVANNGAVMDVQSVGMTFHTSTNTPVKAIDEITFHLNQGEILAIVGPSGCGKSTLFNIIAGLIEPSEGSVEVSGRLVQGAAGHVGYMLQKDLLLPWLNVRDNVMLGLRIKRTPQKESRAIAHQLIETYGLSGFEFAMPSTLSGGMRQRVAFMRTLAFDPDVILLDEPFSALDFQTRMLLQGEVMRIIRERGKSAILVTHDIGEAITMGDRVIVLTNRPARVCSIHRINLAEADRNPITIRKKPAYQEYFDSIWSELDIRNV